MLAGIRQLLFPPEFRIAPPVQQRELKALMQQVAQLEEAGAAPAQPAGEDPEAIKERMRFLVELGTGLWRVRRSMLDPDTDEPLEGIGRAYRHLESTWDAMVEAGITIKDHTGEVVPEGGRYAVKVLSFEPTPGIGRETVVQTIRPTIYYQDELIQMAEVIVATPERQEGES